MPTPFEQITIFLAGLHHLKSDDPALQARMHCLLQLATIAVWISTISPGIKRLWRRDHQLDVWVSVLANGTGFVVSGAMLFTVIEDVALELTLAVAACSAHYLHHTFVRPPPEKPVFPVSAVPINPSSSPNSNHMTDLLREAIESALKLAAPGVVIEPSPEPFIKFGDYMYTTTVYNLSRYQPATPSVPPPDSKTTATSSVPPPDSETTATSSVPPPAASTSSPLQGFMYKLIYVVATRA